MDLTWIQVFVLTLSECVAPAGKTVCQENEVEMQFLSKAECQVALEQLISLKDQFDNTIIDRQKSACKASARQTSTYASLEEAKASSDSENWQDPEADQGATKSTDVPHADRLRNLKTCEESLGIPPCKSGDIIVEGAVTDSEVEVWRSVQ